MGIMITVPSSKDGLSLSRLPVWKYFANWLSSWGRSMELLIRLWEITVSHSNRQRAPPPPSGSLLRHDFSDLSCIQSQDGSTNTARKAEKRKRKSYCFSVFVSSKIFCFPRRSGVVSVHWAGSVFFPDEAVSASLSLLTKWGLLGGWGVPWL